MHFCSVVYLLKSQSNANIGNDKFFSKIINDIRNPKWNNYRCKVLRTKCTKLEFVDYNFTQNTEYVNDRYPILLQKYQSAIAADTYTPVQKYWEIPAAGCLTFMEITKKNNGEYLGFIDDESSIFINEKNYQDKFNEYLENPNLEKWKRIAENGRNHAMKNLNNDIATKELVDLMTELL